MRQAKTIGSILLDVELVTQQDIEQALELQKQNGKRLGEVLVGLGVVSDDDIRWALAEQLNLPYVNIRKDQVDPEIAMLLPEKLARRYHVIPILKIDDELTVVVDDPLNTTVIKDIEAVTKCRVKISLGRTSDIMQAIDEIYGASDGNRQEQEEEPPRFVSSWFDEEHIQRILNDPSGHILVDMVISNAFAHGVSQIYFQPGFTTCHISYNVNGVIQEQIQLGKEWYSIAVFRLKVSAGFEITQLHTPQYREFAYWEHVSHLEEDAMDEQAVMAVSILPTAAGESIVLHIIHKSLEQIAEIPVQDEGLPDFQTRELEALRTVKEELHYLKNGIIFLGGSPYSTKISTLYSWLKEFDPVKKKIMTLESYLEYRADKYYQIRYSGKTPDSSHLRLGGEVVFSDHPGSSTRMKNIEKELEPSPPVSGTSVNQQSEIGQNPHLFFQFSQPDQAILATLLALVHKQYADVVLVDHIESDPVLFQCLNLASERMVVGGMNVKNVYEILAYLRESQVKTSILLSRLHAILAQQTVRLLCPQCKQADTSEVGTRLLETYYTASSDTSPHTEEDRPQLFAPLGCPACGMTGYSGTLVLLEVLTLSPWLKTLLAEHASLERIRHEAEQQGFLSLQQKALDLLFHGNTSIEEVMALLR